MDIVIYRAYLLQVKIYTTQQTFSDASPNDFSVGSPFLLRSDLTGDDGLELIFTGDRVSSFGGGGVERRGGTRRLGDSQR